VNKKPGVPGKGEGTNAKGQTQAQAEVGGERNLWRAGNAIVECEAYPPLSKELSSMSQGRI